MAKFDPFLSLDFAKLEGVGAQSKERKGSNFAAQRSGAIVLKPEGPNTYDLKNPAKAIWQPCFAEVCKPLTPSERVARLLGQSDSHLGHLPHPLFTEMETLVYREDFIDSSN